MGIAYNSMCYATHQHRKQLRKFTNEPYIIHLAEVAGICATVVNVHSAVSPEVIIACAWLHDVVEDTDSSVSIIHQMFGKEVAQGIHFLTCESHDDKNVAENEYTKKLAIAPSWVQTIKCADMISNLRNIWTTDAKFATGYTKRCRERIEVLKNADSRLQQTVVQLLECPKKKNEKSKV